MRQVRKFLSWCFAISCLVCIPLALGGIVRLAREPKDLAAQRALLFSALFTAVATIFGFASITGWKGKASAKGWGTCASLIYILLPVWLNLKLSRPIRGSFGVMLGVGAVGLVTFLWPYESREHTPRVQEYTTVPKDGTNQFVNKLIEYMIVVATVATYLLWVKWERTEGILRNHGKYQIVLIALIALVITGLHELGHAATGLILGMKLRALVVGPFQWHKSEGKWGFKFRPKEIFSADGATGIVPATPDLCRRDILYMVGAGPLVNFFAGIVSVWIVSRSQTNSSIQAGGLVALFGMWSLTLFIVNLIPFRIKDSYSDGATILQLILGGPIDEFRRIVAVVGSSLVSPLRPRDYDTDAIVRTQSVIKQGMRGILLRLYGYTAFLDQGKIYEAGEQLREAEAIYHRSRLDIPAELYTTFVFGYAYVLHDAMAARDWWMRMEANTLIRPNVDYWRAASALHWIEGDLKEANEAWEKGNALAGQLPKAGAYEFDRDCYSNLRNTLDGVSPLLWRNWSEDCKGTQR